MIITRFKRSGKRNDIFLGTKGGMFLKPERAVNGEPDYIRSRIEQSFSRLGVDYIDLYYLHRPDPTVPIEKTVEVMAKFVK